MTEIILYLIERFKTMLDYAVLAVIAATACVLVLPHWRNNWGYAFGAVFSGIACGWCIEQTSYSQWSFFASAISTVAAPSSIIVLQSATGKLPKKWEKIYKILRDKE